MKQKNLKSVISTEMAIIWYYHPGSPNKSYKIYIETLDVEGMRDQ